MDHYFGLLLLLFTVKTLQSGFSFYLFSVLFVFTSDTSAGCKFFAALESRHNNEKHIAMWEGPLRVDAVTFLYFYGTFAT